MKIGVFATFMSPNATPSMIKDFGKRAEGMGLESIWMGEHVALFDKNTYGYPGSKDGRIPVPPGGGMLDVTATLGFLAAATTKVRFGTGVALAALHDRQHAVAVGVKQRLGRADRVGPAVALDLALVRVDNELPREAALARRRAITPASQPVRATGGSASCRGLRHTAIMTADSLASPRDPEALACPCACESSLL